MIHYLKTLPEFFEAVFIGSKTFEIRYNDRNFQEGDTVILEEYFKGTESYSGRKLARRITYVFYGQGYGLEKDYVILSIQ
jgi:hypothetical protein